MVRDLLVKGGKGKDFHSIFLAKEKFLHPNYNGTCMKVKARSHGWNKKNLEWRDMIHILGMGKIRWEYVMGKPQTKGPDSLFIGG